MNREEAADRLKALGIRKAFRVRIEPETEAIAIETRTPAQIESGDLAGSEIVLERDGFRVWTQQARKARALAKAHGLKIHDLDGEAELLVPAEKADALLPKLGAKTRRELSPEARAALATRLATLNASNFQKNAHKTEVPGAWTPPIVAVDSRDNKGQEVRSSGL